MERGTLGSHEEQVLDAFYGAFPYPWRPMRFDTFTDPAFYANLASQDLGDYSLSRIGPGCDIWVAGCGTNQALIVALRFPEANVLGTDASAMTLEMCAEYAKQIGVKNLTLKQEGVSQATHTNKFDYVICTGVIHHNPDPAACLARLRQALRPDGVLELMVYNTFHRQEPTAFQKALRLLQGDGSDLPAERRLQLARRLADSIPPGNLLARGLALFDGPSDAAWADTWINPCEHSYTVDELWDMARNCDLEIEAPVVNQFDQVDDSCFWHLSFDDAELQDNFDALDDPTRWQVVNQLLLDRSPMLWFYLVPKSARRRVTEAERSEAFLNTVFARHDVKRQGFVLNPQGGYRPLPRPTPVPAGPPPEAAASVFAATDGTRTMREVLTGLGIEIEPWRVHQLRLQLTTTQLPFLRACR
jgi:SAM-dependent methyltransferase